jgi:hypothetical protein
MASTAQKPRAPITAWAATAALSVVLSCGAAAVIARLLYPDSFAVAFWVFGFSLLGPFAALMWLLIISRFTVQVESHAEQGVETSWLHQAGFGALTDVFLLAGVGSAILGLSGFPLSGTAALMGAAVLAAGSLGVRYSILRHRNS